MNRQLFQYPDTFGYHFIPGLRARVEHEGGGYLVPVNGADFRCEHEVVPEKPGALSHPYVEVLDAARTEQRLSEVLSDEPELLSFVEPLLELAGKLRNRTTESAEISPLVHAMF